MNSLLQTWSVEDSTARRLFYGNVAHRIHSPPAIMSQTTLYGRHPLHRLCRLPVVHRRRMKMLSLLGYSHTICKQDLPARIGPRLSALNLLTKDMGLYEHCSRFRSG